MTPQCYEGGRSASSATDGIGAPRTRNALQCIFLHQRFSRNLCHANDFRPVDRLFYIVGASDDSCPFPSISPALSPFLGPRHDVYPR